jgi:hypothetical protein
VWLNRRPLRDVRLGAPDTHDPSFERLAERELLLFFVKFVYFVLETRLWQMAGSFQSHSAAIRKMMALALVDCG